MTPQDKLKEIKLNLRMDRPTKTKALFREEAEFLVFRIEQLEKACHSGDCGLTALLENEELECRQDENCDHCLALSCQSDIHKALETMP